MNMELLKEKIGILKNEMSHLWSAILATFGGSVVLLINNNSFIHKCFGILGLFAFTVFVNSYIIKRIAIIKLLKNMEE